MTKREKANAFAQGVAYACAILADDHDIPSIAKEILNAAGYATIADLTEAGVDSYDIGKLKKAEVV